MSFLDTTLTYTHVSTLSLPSSSSENVETGLDTALAILHNHTEMMHLNPLITGMRLLAPDDPKLIDIAKLSDSFNLPVNVPGVIESWQQYEIVDTLPVAFGYSKEMVYHAVLRNRVDGYEGLVEAPSNVMLHGAWYVKPGKKGVNGNVTELEVTETTVCRCNVFLSLYIKTTFGSSHDATHKAFKEKWERLMGETAGM